jgi:hypothetical protein
VALRPQDLRRFCRAAGRQVDRHARADLAAQRLLAQMDHGSQAGH